MNDLISRQDAIEAVQNRHMMLNKEKVLLINDLEKLPPAQSEPCEDAVSREKVKELAYSQIRSEYSGIALKEQRETMFRLADNIIGLLPSVTPAQPEPPEECERCMMEHTDEMEKLEAELAMAQPKRGRWISADAIFGGVPFYCSECGENTRDTVMGKPRWNFCPNCGAKMEVTT